MSVAALVSQHNLVVVRREGVGCVGGLRAPLSQVVGLCSLVALQEHRRELSLLGEGVSEARPQAITDRS